VGAAGKGAGGADAAGVADLAGGKEKEEGVDAGEARGELVFGAVLPYEGKPKDLGGWEVADEGKKLPFADGAGAALGDGAGGEGAGDFAPDESCLPKPKDGVDEGGLPKPKVGAEEGGLPKGRGEVGKEGFASGAALPKDNGGRLVFASDAPGAGAKVKGDGLTSGAD
jgi:hypothetical protein